MSTRSRHHHPRNPSRILNTLLLIALLITLILTTIAMYILAALFAPLIEVLSLCLTVT